MYQCESEGDFFAMQDEPGPENVLLENEGAGDSLAAEGPLHDPRMQVASVLHNIASTAAEEYGNDVEEEELRVPKDPDLVDVDGEQLVRLTEIDDERQDSEQAEPMSMESLPRTLRSALRQGDMFANLWQLAVFLRCGRQGIDAEFLRRAEVVRARAGKLNWQQLLSGKRFVEFG